MYINNYIYYLKFLKNKRIFIWGAGVNGKKCCRRLIANGYDVKAFIDNSNEKIGTILEEKNILSFNQFEELNNKNTMVIVCSGYEKQIKQQMLDNGVYNFISEKQIDFGGGEEYYDELYFENYSKTAEFSGRISCKLFQKYVSENMTVIDFGCGGGHLLKNLNAKEKIGVEINDVARAFAKKQGIKSVKYADEIEDNYADIIISTNVLEHVENPLECLRILRNKLKEEGKIVFLVPNESCNKEYSRSEINNHLYTWNCLNIGNLFKAAGFFVHSVMNIQEVWPKNFETIAQEVSGELFDVICEMGGVIHDENRCLIVAYK